MDIGTWEIPVGLGFWGSRENTKETSEIGILGERREYGRVLLILGEERECGRESRGIGFLWEEIE